MKRSVLISFVILISGLSIAQNNAHTTLVNANNQFAIDLYQKLQTPANNLFFSPVSINMALLATYEGSSGKTKKAFERVLHLEQSISDQDKAIFISSHTGKFDSENFFNFSNSLWINKDFEIRTDFQNKVQKIYLSEAKTLDTSNPQKASLEINKWVSDRTNNRIKNIINPGLIGPFTNLIILNTLYFNAKWNRQFPSLATRPRKFYMLDGTVRDLNSMSNLNYVKYFENNEVQIIKIPYIGLKKSFCIILPKKKDGLPDFEKTLTASRLDSLYKNMKNERVNYVIPKFKLEEEFRLEQPLIDLGLGQAFNHPDFSGISEKDNLTINAIIHKTFIEISEEKTEAAAATEEVFIVGYSGKGLPQPPEPKLFYADHPFLFMILDEDQNEILFIGKYVRTNL